jgi:hypothetical protein
LLIQLVTLFFFPARNCLRLGEHHCPRGRVWLRESPRVLFSSVWFANRRRVGLNGHGFSISPLQPPLKFFYQRSWVCVRHTRLTTTLAGTIGCRSSNGCSPDFISVRFGKMRSHVLQYRSTPPRPALTPCQPRMFVCDAVREAFQRYSGDAADCAHSFRVPLHSTLGCMSLIRRIQY